jgi:EmrB/QacA subfamily drug resistance transporter
MSAHTRLIIATLMVAAFTIGTDFTGALLLVSAIEDDFGADITTTQWVLNIYAMTFSMFMVAGGRLGDMHGRRRLFLIGSVIFAFASMLCFLAPSIGWLVGARALQGVGAAIMWPCILASGTTVVEEDQRGLVMGLILAGVTSGNVIGPLISGVVVSVGDWRLFFLINAVLSVLGALMVMRYLPKDPARKSDERIDFAGMIVLSGAILALLYALDVGADLGWLSPPIVGLLVLSVLLFVFFLFVETRVVDPIVPVQLMRNRVFLLTLSSNAFCVPAVFIAFLYFPQYLQKVLGWTILEASFGMLPLMAVLAVGSAVAGNFYASLGPKRLMLLGYSVIALGSASVVFMEPSWGYFAILPALILIGGGATMSVSPAGTATVSAVAPARAGLAGGLAFMVHLAFGAIGVAAATAVMFATSLATMRHNLAEAGIDMSSADRNVLNGRAFDSDAARAVLARFNVEDTEKIHSVLVDAFVRGMSLAYWLALVSAIVGLIVVNAIDEKKLRDVEG